MFLKNLWMTNRELVKILAAHRGAHTATQRTIGLRQCGLKDRNKECNEDKDRK
jgi:hypothetical protein